MGAEGEEEGPDRREDVAENEEVTKDRRESKRETAEEKGQIGRTFQGEVIGGVTRRRREGPRGRRKEERHRSRGRHRTKNEREGVIHEKSKVR